MRFVTFPFNYEELPAAERDAIVPIYVMKVDAKGHEISWPWFMAINAVQNPLRNLARHWLQDVRRVSELTDTALQIVWRKHGEDFGHHPSGRFYAQAKWCARDLKWGTERDRRYWRRNVALDALDVRLQEAMIPDQVDYELKYRRDIDLARVGEHLRAQAAEDISEMIERVLDGETWDQIGKQMNRNGESASRKFRRYLIKMAERFGRSQCETQRER